MKIQEILEAKMRKGDDYDPDFDDEDDSPEDPEADKIPHIIMQLRKAIDVDGNYPIKFKDGTSTKLSMEQIANFIKKYMTAKPQDKEAMQNQAIKSIKDFMAASELEVAKREPSLYNKGSRYMSHFAGDFDE
jgi:hypothetical protein